MNLSDNAVALRTFADALDVGDGEDMNNKGKRSLCQFLRDGADEIEALRIENIKLRAENYMLKESKP